MSDTLRPHTLQLLLFLWKRKESPDATVSFFNLCKIAQELVSLIDVNFLGISFYALRAKTNETKLFCTSFEAYQIKLKTHESTPFIFD